MGALKPARRRGARRTSSTLCTPDAATTDRVFSIKPVAKIVEHALGGFVEFQFLRALRVAALDFFIKSREQRHLGANHFDIQHMRFVAVVEVGGVVGDLVDEIDELRFDRRTLVEQIFRERGKLRRVVIARMFDDAFADFKRQIEAGKIQIALLELLDDPQRLQIVIEAVSMRAQQFIELSFSRVAERRVPDVVHQGQGLGEIGVEFERSGDGARNLRDFQRVREAVAEMVGIARGEDLRFCFEAAERPRMDHAIAVARVVVAVRMRRFGITPAARFRCVHRIGGQCHGTILCHGASDAKWSQVFVVCRVEFWTNLKAARPKFGRPLQNQPRGCVSVL